MKHQRLFITQIPSTPKQKKLVKSDWVMEAADWNGKQVAIAPNMEQLEKSLDFMFKYQWVGYVGLA